MLSKKNKTLKDFKNIREYYNYLMSGKEISDFGYNVFLRHSHPDNKDAIKKYREYRTKLSIEVYKRLLNETGNKSLVDNLFKKQYFLNREPLQYKLKAPVSSFSELVNGLKKYHAEVNRIAKEKYGLAPIVIKGEESCFLCKRTRKVVVVEEYNDNNEFLMLCPHVHEKVFAESGITKRFETKSFDNFIVEEDNKAAVTVLKKYAENFDIALKSGESLLLMGPVGTGKTHLAVAVLMELIYKPLFYAFKPLRNRYISLPILLSELKATGDEKILKDAADAEFLIIDDLGIETLDEWGKEKVFTLINKRYQNKLPTLFISDLSPSELVNKLDERIISRLHEMARGVVISGRDKRRFE